MHSPKGQKKKSKLLLLASTQNLLTQHIYDSAVRKYMIGQLLKNARSTDLYHDHFVG